MLSGKMSTRTRTEQKRHGHLFDDTTGGQKFGRPDYQQIFFSFKWVRMSIKNAPNVLIGAMFLLIVAVQDQNCQKSFHL